VPGYSSVEEVTPLDDRIRQRDQHEHGPGYPEYRTDSTARKPRRAVNKKAKPTKQQEAEDANDDYALTFFHGYASTAMSPVGFA
jgi:hypothetical protein